MNIVSWKAVALIVLGLPALPSTVQAGDPDSSDWSKGLHSRARLVAAGPASAGERGPGLLAGVDVRLDPRYITYWRYPGESGVPPSFSFDGSENVASAEVRFPAPRKLIEGGSEVFGYENDVIFPVFIMPRDRTAPVLLALSLDYAVCDRICIPEHAQMKLSIGENALSTSSMSVRESATRVPKIRTLGEKGEIEIVALHPVSGDRRRIDVEARVPGASAAELFPEAPEGWFAKASPAEADGERITFPVTILESPKGADPAGAEFRFTLVAGDQAVEVTTRLDGTAPKP